jgi:hypothetical protein
MKFSFVDSKPGQECQEYARKRIPRLLSAIDQLNEATVGGVVELLALSARRRAAPVALTPLITYAVTGHIANYSWDVVAEARFNLSHYIGSYSTKVGDDAGLRAVILDHGPQNRKVVFAAGDPPITFAGSIDFRSLTLELTYSFLLPRQASRSNSPKRGGQSST